MAGKSAMRGKTEAVPRSTKATKRLSVDELVAFMSLPIFYELRTAVDVGILLFDDLDEYDLHEGYSMEDIWRILLAVLSSNLSRYHRSPGLVPAISKRRYRE